MLTCGDFITEQEGLSRDVCPSDDLRVPVQGQVLMSKPHTVRELVPEKKCMQMIFKSQREALFRTDLSQVPLKQTKSYKCCNISFLVK